MAGVSLRIAVWAALLALLALTVGLSFAPLGPFRLTVSLVIALAKAALVWWVYMDLRKEGGLMRIASVVALFFLGVLFLMSGLDFAVRSGVVALS